MPLKLKNANIIPDKQDVETVHCLGLDIPIEGDLSFGGQLQASDLQKEFEDGKFGQNEYLMRLFCLYTTRLPKRDHVKFDWLSQQKLEMDEITSLLEATTKLIQTNATDEFVDKQEKISAKKSKTAN